MHNKSLSRELSLISLGLIKDKGDFKLNNFQIEEIFDSALDSLINHCRDELDNCESELENASQKILDSELQEGVNSSFSNVRDLLKKSLVKMETVMNTLSITLDFPKLIVSSNTGISINEISYISPLWTYKLLTLLSVLMIIGELFAFLN